MKCFSLLTLVLFFTVTLEAQVDPQLRRDVVNTGYVHSPLPMDYSKSFETMGLKKKVLTSDMYLDMESLNGWTHDGWGSIRLTNERSIQGKSSLRLVAPTRNTNFMSGVVGMGISDAVFDVGGKNWEKYNRIHFYIYPDCDGARSIYLNLHLVNDGKIKVPDKYGREGIHEINLKNGQWNECFIEMPELPRDKITQLRFGIEIFGQEITMGDSLKFDIDALSLQKIENPEIVEGWMPAPNRIIFSTSGYRAGGEKTAIVNVAGNDGSFQLIDANSGGVVYNGKIEKTTSRIGSFETIDFTGFTLPGQYSLRVGNVTTAPFFINDDVWDNSVWRVLNFLFVERCGYPVPGKHEVDHTDLHAVFRGKIYPFSGGWHDAADMSQQVLQSAEVTYSLFEMAKTAKEKGDVNLYNRLVEEAKWGVNIILRSRLEDGYRAQTWGTNLWTDGYINTDDDSTRRRLVRVHNRAFENYVFAGIEAYASTMIDDDAALKGNLRKVAIEDYAYAKARFDSLGFAEMGGFGNGGDHASMASNSQYAANISFAASLLFQMTGDKFYAVEAAKAIKYTLDCQRTEPLRDARGTRGFFYRDLNKKSIVHYNHQSRDQIFMQALTALCWTQPDNPDYSKWAGAIKLYGDYLKEMMTFVKPYGLVPSGVYDINEWKDSLNFYKWQVGVFRNGGPDYIKMLQNGVRLDDDHYVKVFPVWYSFRGNVTVQLSTGKAAALAGRFLKDKDLTNIAEQQLMWVVGKNPFGQSMIWGEGSNYPQLYTALPGETVGGIPVGMKSKGDDDKPYFPQWNTATFKEVWTSSAARWVSLAAEF